MGEPGTCLGVCAICDQEIIVPRWGRDPRVQHIPPLCYPCEFDCANVPRGWMGNRGNKVHTLRGAFRDRRKAVQILALAEAITGEANRQVYHGTA